MATGGGARTEGPVRIEVSTSGNVQESERDYALEKVSKVLASVDEPILHGALRLDRAADPARVRPALARVRVDVDGRLVRAQVAAETMTEAADLLERRLAHRLEHLAAHRRALRRRGPTSPAGEWRHGDLPVDRPPFFPRPVEEREVVRRKTYGPGSATVDEAVEDLEALDHEVYLFTELESGEDAVVHRLPGGSYGVRYLGGAPDGTRRPATPPVVSVVVEPEPAPRLSVEEAEQHLDEAGEPWVFFADAGTGRGHLLYRRYDGHYGLVVPPDEET